VNHFRGDDTRRDSGTQHDPAHRVRDDVDAARRACDMKDTVSDLLREVFDPGGA
jgi:hypothetical protein